MLSGVDADTQSALVGFVAEPGSANFDVTAKTQVNARASSAFGIHPYFSTRLLMGYMTMTLTLNLRPIKELVNPLSLSARAST